uniref:UBC core domain-containing protein n=1 Tax=Panagrolaimus sp. ES5 TaxID=591445 RepID=A0AC34FVG7_9BILA
MSGLKRLKFEWDKILQYPPQNCYPEPENGDSFYRNVTIMGPPKSPYMGNALFLKIQVPRDYPFKPPDFFFCPPIFHPNINETGEMCADFLMSSRWSPSTTIRDLLVKITSTLANPIVGHPLNPFATRMYENDPERYYRNARDSCKKGFDYKIHNRYGIVSLKDLTYPSENLDDYFKMYEKNSFSFIPLSIIKAHKRAKELYPFIKAAQEDYEKWINVMMESGDNEFVEDGIEFRLYNDFENEKLWKLYFQFLEKHDKKKLLLFYSKYCRFFPSDNEMLDKYEKAIQKFGPNLVPWKNPFTFETFAENAFNHIQTEKKVEEKLQKIMCYFKKENISSQNLPFQLPFINYILKIAPPEVLQKLHKTCKYFFLRLSTPICYKLEIKREKRNANFVMFKENSAKIINNIQENSYFQNIRVSTVLSATQIDNHPQSLSNCLTKINQCDAKYISIFGQHLSEAEIIFLISSTRVVDLELWDVNRNEKEGIMLENILKYTPNIEKIKLNCVQCNEETATAISKMHFTSKIKLIHLENIFGEDLQPYEFGEFIKKNIAKNGKIAIQFLSSVSEDYKNNVVSIVECAITEKWPQSDGPKISIQ